MEEEILNDSLPYLKELENKVGRKTPQSLLIWIKDAADCEDGCRSDGERESSSAFNDNFADKIRTLKQEMVTSKLFSHPFICHIIVRNCVLNWTKLSFPTSARIARHLGNAATCVTRFSNLRPVYSGDMFPP